MKRMAVILLLSFVAFSSCTKTYTCNCKGMTKSDIIFTTTVTGKNANDAQSECLGYETTTTVCILSEQPKR